MTVSVFSLEDRIDLVKRWLLGSGIQSSEGGFYAWQDMKDKSSPYLYSEITGYAITMMCFLYKLTKDDVFLRSARNSARWIMQDALDSSGGVLTRDYLKDSVEHYSFERGNIYSFDCAMVAFGMMKLFEITGDEEHLACAEKIVNFLNKKMLKPNGLYYPIFDIKKSTPYESTEKWSTQSGSFHCKLALSLCELASIKKEPSYVAMARRLIDASLENFYEEGRFITGSADKTSHLHPYSYTLEGMLFYANKTGDDSYNDTIRDAFDWMVNLQDESGGFPTRVFGDGRRSIAYSRSDIQSQILRLSYFIKSSFDREKLMAYLLELQNTDDGYKGGFIFGMDEHGVFQKHSNAWCSMFAIQALYLASGRAAGDIVMDHLV